MGPPKQDTYRRRLLLCAMVLTGCRGDAPASGLPAVQLAAPDTPAGTPAPTSEPPARDLWWAAGPGREAILARERGDQTTARPLLERIAGDPAASPDDRGAAAYLLGSSQVASREFAAAADSFRMAEAAPGLVLVQPRVRLLRIQALLDAGRVDEAWSLLEGFDPPPPLRAGVVLARADAAARLDRREEARDGYTSYLRAHAGEARATEARVKLARMLEQGAPAEQGEARDLWERVELDAPLSDFGEEATRRLAELDRSLRPARRGADARAHQGRVSLARLHALVDRRRYADAVREADRFLATRRLPEVMRCEALYVKGTAIFKQRKRADARAVFDQAGATCTRAGADDLAVKSRYQGARGWYAAGKHERAARAFETLAKDAPAHSYADDAWLLAGEAWQEANEADRARAAYDRVVAAGGDMADEGWRRGMVLEWTRERHADALVLLDRVLAEPPADRVAHARAHYWRGRTLDRLGRSEDAKGAYLSSVEVFPLDYPALQALSRLREMGPEHLEAGLAHLEREGAAGPLPTAPTGEGAQRAQVLARLGLAAEAAEELQASGITGWSAVALLDQAGAYAQAQRAVGNLGQAWRAEGPAAPTLRWRWTLAHPQPFRELVLGREVTHGVPALLAYGIMQTESQFNPAAVSWAGARGLIQLMPATAQDVARLAGKPLPREEDLHDPATNLELGIGYLGSLIARFRDPDAAPALAVPAYNAGVGAVDGWLRARGHWDLDLFIEGIPYDETRKYVQKVLGRWLVYRWLYGEGPAAARIPHLPLQVPGRVQRSGG